MRHLRDRPFDLLDMRLDQVSLLRPEHSWKPVDRKPIHRVVMLDVFRDGLDLVRRVEEVVCLLPHSLVKAEALPSKRKHMIHAHHHVIPRLMTVPPTFFKRAVLEADPYPVKGAYIQEPNWWGMEKCFDLAERKPGQIDLIKQELIGK